MPYAEISGEILLRKACAAVQNQCKTKQIPET
jgi:hypothetical protein